jgi:hypothetical protein
VDLDDTAATARTPSGGTALPQASAAGPLVAAAAGAPALGTPAVLPAAAVPAAQPAPPAPRSSGVPLVPLLLIGGLVVAAGLAAGAWWLLRERPAKEVATGPIAQPTAVATVGPPVQADEARLLVMASPWAEVTEIRGANGAAVTLPAQRTTPLVLNLSPGRYTVTLAHPGAAQPASCEAEVVRGQAATCQAQVVAVDVMQYFKEAGWWQ